MKVVCFSDAHADATTAGVDRFDDVASACDEVVLVAQRERADLALFLGDLCDPDTSRSHRAVALLARVARVAEESGIRFRAIVGNHDVVEDGLGTSTLSPLAGAGFVVHGRPSVEDFGGLRVVYLPYPPRSFSYDPEAYVRETAGPLLSSMRGEKRSTCPVPVFVAGHLMIRGADPGSESAELARGRDVFWPEEAIREAFGKGALLVGGHYHRRQVTRGGIQVVGSLARLRFDEETHEPGFLVCETPPKRGGAWAVRFERVKRARALVTIGPSSALWERPVTLPGNVAGAIVRARPPASATDEQVDDLQRRLERYGALKVHVEPRAPGAAVVAPERAAPRARRKPREVVLEMAARARTDDRPALVDALDRELSAQKL